MTASANRLPTVLGVLDRLDADDHLRSIVEAVTTARDRAGQPIDASRINEALHAQLATSPSDTSSQLNDPADKGWGRPATAAEWIHRRIRARRLVKSAAAVTWMSVASCVTGVTMGVRAKTHYLEMLRSGIDQVTAYQKWHDSWAFFGFWPLFLLGSLGLFVGSFAWATWSARASQTTPATATEKERRGWRRVPAARAYQLSHPEGEVPLLRGDRAHLNALVNEYLECQMERFQQDLQS